MQPANTRPDTPSPIIDGRGPDPHPAHAASHSSTVELSVDGDHAVEWLAGDIDVSNAEHVAEVGMLAIAESRVDDVVVDMSQVTFLDSTGLGALIELRNHAGTVDKRMSIRGVTPPVMKVLTLTGMASAFGVAAAADAGRC